MRESKTLIMSDMHLGNGGAYDIYAGGDALPRLLEAIEPPLDVVLNGDTTDFLLDDKPLSLHLAVERARAIASSTPGRAVFAALGRVLEAGGSVLMRTGNHDLECALPSVQAVFREALAQPDSVKARLAFDVREEPLILNFDGIRAAVTHGEYDDDFNRFDYRKLAAFDSSPLEFEYPAGSVLVKEVLNPLKLGGLRFLDLLKPDFHGAVLAALATDPSTVRAVLKRSTLTILWRLVMNRLTGAPFEAEDSTHPVSSLATRLNETELDREELAALAMMLNPELESLAVGAQLSAALRKVGRTGFELYARAHRRMAGPAGAEFFDIQPGEEEWREACRIAHLYNASIVVTGHSHARRFKAADGIAYANAGTWMWLMRLPSPEATAAEWADFLQSLSRDPGLREPGWLESQPSACLLEVTDNGLDISLLDCANGCVERIATASVART